jgi:hypothetical protein
MVVAHSIRVRYAATRHAAHEMSDLHASVATNPATELFRVSQALNGVVEGNHEIRQIVVQ